MPAPLEPFVIEAVLIPTRFSEDDTSAVVHALKIALAAKGRLSYLHVGARRTADVHWRDFPNTRQILAAWGILPEGAEHDAVLGLGLSVRKSLRKGTDLATEIGGEIRKAGADLVVVSRSSRRGLLGRFRRDATRDIARRVDRPVLFVSSEEGGFVDEDTGAVRLENIVVASGPDLDPSDCLEAALGLALVVAPGPVTLHVAVMGDAQDQAEYVLPRLPAGWKVETVEADGDLVGALLGTADQVGADLVVVPGYSPAGVRDRLRGTVTERVIARSASPVLMVPQ